jgi:hypothetical protein
MERSKGFDHLGLCRIVGNEVESLLPDGYGFVLLVLPVGGANPHAGEGCTQVGIAGNLTLESAVRVLMAAAPDFERARAGATNREFPVQ